MTFALPPVRSAITTSSARRRRCGGRPDAHYDRAKATGAEVLGEPHDAMGGHQRGYSARDLEGNLWSFGTSKPERVPHR
jgi:uncharacterized glyoxalase superfamily protein PhnB